MNKKLLIILFSSLLSMSFLNAGEINNKNDSNYIQTYSVKKYNKGFIIYKKYIKLKLNNLKSPEFIEKAEIDSPEDVEELFADNGKLFKEKLLEIAKELKKEKKIQKSIKFLNKKDYLDDLKNFFKGIVLGNIPASCDN